MPIHPPGTFVNSIASSAKRPLAASSENCASCSAAGAVCLLLHSHRAATSAQAGDFAGSVRPTLHVMPNFKMGDSVEEQCRNIELFVRSRVGCSVMTSPPDMTLQAATQWMYAQPMGTIFVVFLEGRIDGNAYYHFLNAARTDKLVYVDFQTNRDGRITGRGMSYPPYPGHLGPATSDTPFIGVLTQARVDSSRGMHASAQAGSVDEDTLKLTLLAFQRL